MLITKIAYKSGLKRNLIAHNVELIIEIINSIENMIKTMKQDLKYKLLIHNNI